MYAMSDAGGEPTETVAVGSPGLPSTREGRQAAAGSPVLRLPAIPTNPPTQLGPPRLTHQVLVEHTVATNLTGGQQGALQVFDMSTPPRKLEPPVWRGHPHTGGVAPECHHLMLPLHCNKSCSCHRRGHPRRQCRWVLPAWRGHPHAGPHMKLTHSCRARSNRMLVMPLSLRGCCRGRRGHPRSLPQGPRRQQWGHPCRRGSQ